MSFRRLLMTLVKRGERKRKRSREVEIEGVVSLQVVPLGELNDPPRREQLKVYSYVEAVEIC